MRQTDELTSLLTKLAAAFKVPLAVLQRDFKAESNEVLALYGPDGAKTYLLGLGAEPQEMDWLKTGPEVLF